MNKLFKRNVSLVLTAMFLICISLAPIPTKAAKRMDSKTIFLRGMEIKSQQAFKPFGDFKNKVYGKNEVGPYIVTFNGPITNSMKAEIEKAGAKLVEYVPEFSFLAMMNTQNVAKVKKLAFVNDVAVYQPAYKIDPILMDNLGKVKNFTNMKVRILGFDKKADVKTIKSSDIMNFANLNNVMFIEPVPEFKFIDPMPETKATTSDFQLLNNVGKDYMGVEGIWNSGYTGEGQVVGIADTGFDTGKNDSSMHKDFQGRIDKIIALGRTTADDPHGHGTHVAGSVLGDGANSNGEIKGMAPKAHVVFQSVLDKNDGLGGLPDDLNDLFKQSWEAGARIHTNSWGAAGNGNYDTTARQVDEYSWKNNQLIILFAAGNEGQKQYGGTAYNSIGSPGSAKNCITVGASENYRKDKNNYADNPNEVAAFSSRGSCKDGRVKPDIMAPGTWILSTKSSKAPVSNFWGEYNDKYAYMGGTSMATPLTAGAVAIAREFMMKEWNHTPSCAFMKAVLVNGATDMGYGYMGKDQGWGRINLVDSLKAKEYKFEDGTKKLATGETANYSYSIESNKTPLKVSLAWNDYPGSTSASKALVNDLDLKITAPSGTVYYGNDFKNTKAADRLNNLENVFINNPEVGTYKVEVVGYNVPQGPQPFSIFATADFGTASADTEVPTCSITAPAKGATVNAKVAINATAKDNLAVTKVEFLVDGKTVGTATTAPYSVEWDTTTVANGAHKLSVKAYDAAGNVGTSTEIEVTVNNEVKDTEAPTCSITAPAKGATVNAKVAINATAKDNVSVAKVEFFVDGQSLGEDTTAPYSIEWDTTAIANGTHKLSVKAYDAAGNVGASTEISVTVNNQIKDTEAPTCSITAPAKGATVNGKVAVNATAKDNVSVAKVEFFVDGKTVGTDTTAPYAVEWDTTTVANGSHKLLVKAYDAAGNVGTSTEITVTVNNQTGGTEEGQYVTKTYSGYSSAIWGPYKKEIDVTAKGKITITSTGNSSWGSSFYSGSDLLIKLYDASGKVVASGKNTISYDAIAAGKYTMEIFTNEWYQNINVKVTYPVAK